MVNVSRQHKEKTMMPIRKLGSVAANAVFVADVSACCAIDAPKKIT